MNKAKRQTHSPNDLPEIRTYTFLNMYWSNRYVSLGITLFLIIWNRCVVSPPYFDKEAEIAVNMSVRRSFKYLEHWSFVDFLMMVEKKC